MHLDGNTLVPEQKDSVLESKDICNDTLRINSTNQLNSVKKHYKWDILWGNVAFMSYVHIGAVYGLYLLFSDCKLSTILWCGLLYFTGLLGATAGAHRLWTHNSYKANLPLKYLLVFLNSTCYVNSVYQWVRDHRTHHKYLDTDADPHNATRGLFFSHVGWLLVKKQTEVIENGKTIYMKDLENDSAVMFQKKYYSILMPLFCFIMPTLIPWYIFGESLSTAWHVAALLRYAVTVNFIWTTNSLAHAFGTRPYDKTILPTDSKILSYFVFGECWHNYHHVFPWDYKASEFSRYSTNITIAFIDFFASIGWAYDLKTASQKIIADRAAKTGDNSPVGAEYEHTNFKQMW